MFHLFCIRPKVLKLKVELGMFVIMLTISNTKILYLHSLCLEVPHGVCLVQFTASFFTNK
jgi:hypothetical protein